MDHQHGVRVLCFDVDGHTCMHGCVQRFKGVPAMQPTGLSLCCCVCACGSLYVRIDRLKFLLGCTDRGACIAFLSEKGIFEEARELDERRIVDTPLPLSLAFLVHSRHSHSFSIRSCRSLCLYFGVCFLEGQRSVRDVSLETDAISADLFIPCLCLTSLFLTFRVFLFLAKSRARAPTQ